MSDPYPLVLNLRASVVMKAVLEITNGLTPGQLFDLTDPKSILGRHPECDVVLEAGAVSRQHAQVLVVEGEFYIEDLNSRNGTFVNDEMIAGRHRLSDQDTLRICDLEFIFHRQKPSKSRLKQPAAEPEVTPLAQIVDDSGERTRSTIMSKIDVSLGDSGLRVEVRPEAKLKALFEITNGLRKALKLDDVLPKILDSLFRIFVQADRGFVVLQDGDRLIPKAVRKRRGNDDEIRISRTIVREVMTSKEAILSADAASDSRFDMSQSIADFRIRSMMCAPLLDSDGNALGVIQIDALDQHGRFQQDDLDILVAVADTAAFAMENAQLHERTLEQQNVQRDLVMAHEVQQSLLPYTRPQLQGYDFFDFYKSANEVGGDYFGYIDLPDGQLAAVLADVAGKGIAAAIIMAKLSSDVRHCLLADPAPGRAMTLINRSFCDDHLEGRFVTMVLAVIDPASGQVTLANAGHMPPMLRHEDSRVEDVGDEETGLPLGVDEDCEYEQCTIELAGGEVLTVFTDGLSEAMDAEGQQYGMERIRDQIATNTASASEIGDHLLDDVREFVGGHPQSDDMCVVCVGRDDR